MVAGISLGLIQVLLDLTVAGISLMVVFGIFSVVAVVLCSAAFYHHAMAAS